MIVRERRRSESDCLHEVAALRERLISRPQLPERGDSAPSSREIIAAVEPFHSHFGITRIGDLTDLDEIGLPVWFAARPNSRSLSVSQGKGLTHDQARVSAVMEAVEGAVSERPEGLVTRVATLREMGDRSVSLKSILRCNRLLLEERRNLAWVPGMSLRTGNLVFAPYELVGFDLRLNSPWDRRAFRMSTIGLAAGFSLSYALQHALLELIENAATAPLEVLGLPGLFVSPLSYAASVHSGLDVAVSKVKSAGLSVRFVYVGNSAGLPVVGAFVDRVIDCAAAGPGVKVCGGFACRTSTAEASLAALLEAVQCRLTDIAGSRDDIHPSDYVTSPARPRVPISQSKDGPSVKMVCEQAPPDPLFFIVSRLLASPVSDIYVFPLECPSPAISVVRVLAADVEAATADGPTALGIGTLRQLLQTG